MRNGTVVAEVKARRYFIESFLTQYGFRRTGKQYKTPLRMKATEWINANGVRVERKSLVGASILKVTILGITQMVFDISTRNERRDKEIEMFERVIKFLNRNAFDSVADDIMKLEDCVRTVKNGKELDPTQRAFLGM